MIFIYITILAVGIFSIVIILIKNKKSQELQPSDLLKNINIDDDEQADPSSSFLKRLRNQEPKKSLGQPQPISSEEAVESLKTQTDRANTKATGQDFEKSSHAPEDLKRQLQDAHAHIQKLRGDLELNKKEIEKSQELISNLKNQVHEKEEKIQSIQQQLENKKNMPMDDEGAPKKPTPSSESHNELSPRNNNDMRSQNTSNESFINLKNNEKNLESQKEEHQEEIAESQKNINSFLNLRDLSKKGEQQQKQKEEKSESESITLLSPDNDPIDSPDLVKKDNLDSEKKLDESQNQNSDNPKLRLNNDELNNDEE